MFECLGLCGGVGQKKPYRLMKSIDSEWWWPETLKIAKGWDHHHNHNPVCSFKDLRWWGAESLWNRMDSDHHHLSQSPKNRNSLWMSWALWWWWSEPPWNHRVLCYHHQLKTLTGLWNHEFSWWWWSDTLESDQDLNHHHNHSPLCTFDDSRW